MFYTAELLALRAHGGIGVVWIAATLGPRSATRRLSRRDCVSVDIAATCAYVSAPPHPLSLRLAASLMLGISRVYGQQCALCYRDVVGLHASLTCAASAAHASSDLGLESSGHRAATRAPKEAITIGNTRDSSLGPSDDASADSFFIEGLDSLLARRLSAPAPPARLSLTAPEAGRAVRSESLAPEVGRLSSSSLLPSSLPFVGLTSAAHDELPMSDVYVPLNDVAGGENDARMSVPGSAVRSLGSASLPPTPGSSAPSLPAVVATRPAKRTRKTRAALVFDDPTVLDREQLLLNDGEALVPAILDEPLSSDWGTDEVLPTDYSRRSTPKRRSVPPPVNIDSDSVVPDSAQDYVAQDEAPMPFEEPSTVTDTSAKREIAHVIRDNVPCLFSDVCTALPMSRATVFVALLEAVTAGIVCADQSVPFGPISVRQV